MKKVLALLALTVALTASAVTMQPQRSFTAKVFNKSQLVNAKAPKFNIPQAKPMRAALPAQSGLHRRWLLCVDFALPS